MSRLNPLDLRSVIFSGWSRWRYFWVKLVVSGAIFAVLQSTSAEPAAKLASSVRAIPSFNLDILPVLTRFGCNQGGCHGKLSGQNGFRLSLRGYAPNWDYDWITKELNGRRLDFAVPEESLLLLKATGAIPHEGGARFRKGSPAWQSLVDWIKARAPGPIPDEPKVAGIELVNRAGKFKPGDRVELAVKARYADGTDRDVTWLAQFFSNDEAIVQVSPQGRARLKSFGQGSVRAHFMGNVAVTIFTLPYLGRVNVGGYARRLNPIDGPVFDQLQRLNLPPSGPCSDQDFIRRAFLDTLGILPTPEESITFCADKTPSKRAQLASRLLDRPEWLDYWALQLADVLQNRKERDHDVRGAKGVRNFHAWIRRQLAAQQGWDSIARAVLLAEGNTREHPQIGYYVTVVGENKHVEQSELPDSVAQSFLGTRIGCARCHNHPLEKYTQDDFYHFSAAFARMDMERIKSENAPTMLRIETSEMREQRKGVEAVRKKLSAAAAEGKSDKEQGELKRDIERRDKGLAEISLRPTTVLQPRTGQQMVAKVLNGTVLEVTPGEDPRRAFAEWMVQSPEFSGSMANRIWKHFMGVGLVEPVDDLRASNPPSNAALWSLLQKEFRGSGFDLRHLQRLILTSRAYQLSSHSLPSNATDTKFYSHYQARRLPAEVLVDAISAASGVPVAFEGYPVGLRAVQLPEPQVSSYFLTLFGRSERVTACACERKGEVTLPQMLNLRNGEELQRQLEAPEGRLSALLKQSDDRVVTQALFSAAFGRDPSAKESMAVQESLQGGPREEVFKDLFWALLNSAEFTFNH